MLHSLTPQDTWLGSEGGEAGLQRAQGEEHCDMNTPNPPVTAVTAQYNAVIVMHHTNGLNI